MEELPNKQKFCGMHDSFVEVINKLDKKLDVLVNSVTIANNKLTELFVRLDEQEKKYRIIDSNIDTLGNKLSGVLTSIALAERAIKDNEKDINALGITLKKVDDKTDTNKTLMYTGAVSGLFALLVVLIKFILDFQVTR